MKIIPILFLLLSLLVTQTKSQIVDWGRNLGGTGSIYSHSIVVDKSHNVINTGTLWGTVDFDPGTAVYNLSSTSSGLPDIFISKLNSNGDFAWAKRIGGTNAGDAGWSCVSDDGNNIYVTGSFEGSVDFDPGSGTYILNANNPFSFPSTFVLKLDSNGNFIWAINFENINTTNSNRGYNLTLDDSNHIILTGNFSGQIDFIEGTGSQVITSVGNFDAYIAKLDTDGSFLWAKTIGGIDGDWGRGVTTDEMGNIYNAGYFTDTAMLLQDSTYLYSTSRSGYIVKYSPNGDLMSTRSFGDSIRSVNYVTYDNNGYVYVCGNLVGENDFDQGLGVYNVQAVDSVDAFLAKFDSEGNLIWGKNFGGENVDEFSALDLDDSHHLYAIGSFSSVVTFETQVGTDSIIAQGFVDGCIIKYNASGQVLRTINIGGDSASVTGWSLFVDDSIRVYATGNFKRNIDVDPSPSTYPLDNDLSNNVFIVKYNQCDTPTFSTIVDTGCGTYISPSGLYVWTSDGTYSDTILSMLGCDSIITVQLTINSIDTSVTSDSIGLQSNATSGSYQWFDCASFTQINGATNASYIPLVAGYYAVEIVANGCTDTSGCHYFDILDLASLKNSESFRIYPSVSDGHYTISTNNDFSIVSLKVTDYTGRILLSTECNQCGNTSLFIPGSTGMYFIEVATNTFRSRVKVVKQHY